FMYGIAFDIGTTTIAAGLVDLKKRNTIAEASVPNPQTRFGNDVISRIEAVAKTPNALAEMRHAALTACNKLISGFGMDAEKISKIAVAGNSVMEHILLGISPEPMGRIPFKTAFKEARVLKAKEAGFNASENASLYVFPLIGGFVGGDSVAAALFLKLDEEKGVTLAIDIGTNSEIMLSTRSGLLTTSAASGPAFEGGNISAGMTAMAGAIEDITIKGDDVTISSIGGVAPIGICGSGIVSVMAELLKSKVMDKTGRIKSKGEITTNLSCRIKEGSSGNSFILFKGAKGEITISQDDVRAFQVAKAAIRAGMEVLFERAEITPDKVEKVFLAGAFGSHIKKDSLETVGLFDREWNKKIEVSGDAALEGAKMALVSDESEKRAEKIASEAKYVPLSGSRLFETRFIENMNFS
ncbi:MAG: ASKHA domain-containing protein, partial [Deltaproteobacteria bacterium]